MKKLTAFVAATAVVASMSTAYAGGPVVVASEPEPVVAAAPASSIGSGVVLGLLALILIGVAVSQSSDT